jgi:radical SAM protein with 4Fe4S-binding SPASM domain
LQRTQCAGIEKKVLTQPGHGLYSVEIRLTKACNLVCGHCSVGAGKKAEGELRPSEVRALIDQVSKIGARYLVFTGGEPLLCKELIPLVEHAAKKGLIVSVDTNGTLLSRENAKALKNAGVSNVQISIDGAKKTHDSIRGQGSFERAVLGIKSCVLEDIPTIINFTVSKLNQKDLLAVADLARTLEVGLLSMERFAPTGRGVEISGALQKPEEFKESLEILLGARGIETNSTDPLSIFLKEETLNSYSKKELTGRLCGGCTAGVAALTVSYDGEVYPCPKLEISCGNIRSSDLLGIWMGSDILNSLRYRKLKGACGVCGWKNLCGGCRAVAHALTGDFLSEDPTCFIGALS